MKRQLKRWYDDQIIFEADTNTLKELVEQAHQSGARLDGARLDGARLDGASLDGASLDGASLVRASLVRASLDGASLDGASLDGARLDGASLDGARLDGARLDGARLDGASLDGASLDGASLVRASLDDDRIIASALQISPLGSRRAQLIAFLCTDQSIVIHTGCFRGSLDKFQDAVRKTHGDNKFGREYQAAIQFILAWAALQSETQKAESK